ncbi:MAG: peptidoglycan editing factor PgeF [Clostridia bacterium]|nr:peptidoglycan editing factor PgeF [Clostridia bacterium]
MPDIYMMRAESGVTYLRASHLPCPHGFSTRLGGVSTHPETVSLNLGRGFADDDATVRENLDRFAAAVGFDSDTLVSLHQIHSPDVRTVTAADAGLGYSRPSDETADGYVTCERGVAIGIRTADCVPILAAAVDEAGRPYAVGAFHAGWRGTVAGIATEGVRRMVALGARVEHIRVAIGPCIHRCCFEIDDAAREVFVAGLGGEMTDRFVLPSREGHYDADLVGINLALLAEVGVSGGRVAVSDLCTRCRGDLLYSHRRDGRKRGSMLSVITLPK